MQKTKKSMLASGLAVLVCVAMLIGTTFAWFTDSVSNKGNTITAGSLKIDATAYAIGKGGLTVSGIEGFDPSEIQFEQSGQDLETKTSPIITEEKWEPGQSSAKLMIVKNTGTLNAKVKLDFNISGDLTDALWYDFIKVNLDNNNAEGDFTRRAMSTLPALGEEREFTLAPNAKIAFVLLYGMDEDAGNIYQGKTFNADVSILATQAPVETDGFGNSDYDKDAEYATYNVSSEEELTAALNAAKDGDIIAAGNFTYDEPLTINADNVTINGNGTVFTSSQITLNGDNTVFNNVSFQFTVESSSAATAPITTNGTDLTLNGCTVERLTDTAQAYGMLVSTGSGRLTAVNTEFIAPYDPDAAFDASPSVIEALGGVKLDGCTIRTNGYGLFSQHVTSGVIRNTLFTGTADGTSCLAPFNSTVLNGLTLDGCIFENSLYPIVAAGNFTIQNCTFNENYFTGGASAAVSIYSQNGPVVLTGNTFNLPAGKTAVNLTSATWAEGSRDGQNLTISGNTFNGTGTDNSAIAIRYNKDWTSISAESFPDNNFNNVQRVVNK